MFDIKTTSKVRKIIARLVLKRQVLRLALYLVCLVALASFVLTAVAARVNSYELVRIKPQRIVVHRGDSLWLIAEKVDPNQDPRAVVAYLEKASRSDSIYPGEIILIGNCHSHPKGAIKNSRNNEN